MFSRPHSKRHGFAHFSDTLESLTLGHPLTTREVVDSQGCANRVNISTVLRGGAVRSQTDGVSLYRRSSPKICGVVNCELFSCPMTTVEPARPVRVLDRGLPPHGLRIEVHQLQKIPRNVIAKGKIQILHCFVINGMIGRASTCLPKKMSQAHPAFSCEHLSRKSSRTLSRTCVIPFSARSAKMSVSLSTWHLGIGQVNRSQDFFGIVYVNKSNQECSWSPGGE